MSDQAPASFGAGWTLTDEAATLTAADSTRALVAALRRADAPTESLERATALIEEATALLAPHRVDTTPMQGRLGPFGPVSGGATEPRVFFPWSPIIGPLNPISGDVELHFAEGRTSGRANLAAQYSGPPGMVHGGIIALIFDELLGATNVCNELGGFTGTLSIRYERPTWIETELELESWVDRVEGRKVFTFGTISINGELTARAEGIFIMTEHWKSEKS
ncbi:MAG: PaaI family thioesterase [Acidimicrobiales bacterium]